MVLLSFWRPQSQRDSCARVILFINVYLFPPPHFPLALSPTGPNLKHLLLPRTTGFQATLDSLRPSHPTVYDLTIVEKGYKGKMARIQEKSSATKLWNMIRGRSPEEVHVQIKRYSLDEVLRDSAWLDKVGLEKGI
mgnify:CR=1 FL=1